MARLKPIRVIQFGLGAIGLSTAALIAKKASLRLVGAVEADDARRKAATINVPIAATLPKLLESVKADIVVHTTGSRLTTVIPQISEIVRAGLHCVSSAEELFFPPPSQHRLAQRLDHLARSAGVAVLGTGVNPGFVMDLLPTVLTSSCRTIKHLSIRRIVDVSKRRVQLQRKVGVGLRESEFSQSQRSGTLGHVGLIESALFVASALQWKIDSIQESTKPIVKRGKVMGVHQFIHMAVGGAQKLSLELRMEAGASDPRDEVRIDGEPSLHMVIPGGVQGDQATAAILVNSIPLVLQAKPGLRTALDLGIPRFIS